jgi:hypothetical protein
MAIAILPAHASYFRPAYGHAADLDGALPRILSKPAAVRAMTTTENYTWRLVATVLLPFAAGYYLSYVFRTINALISGPLATEFGLSAAEKVKTLRRWRVYSRKAPGDTSGSRSER